MPETKEEDTAVRIAPEANAENLPAVVARERARPAKRGRRRRGLWFLLFLVVGAGAGYWWLNPGPALPPGFASGNGRLEADELDIDTRFAGRIRGASGR